MEVRGREVKAEGALALAACQRCGAVPRLYYGGVPRAAVIVCHDCWNGVRLTGLMFEDTAIYRAVSAWNNRQAAGSAAHCCGSCRHWGMRRGREIRPMSTCRWAEGLDLPRGRVTQRFMGLGCRGYDLDEERDRAP